MEIKNGIMIDGLLHESSEGLCNECSLCQECSNLLDDNYCALLDLGNRSVLCQSWQNNRD